MTSSRLIILPGNSTVNIMPKRKKVKKFPKQLHSNPIHKFIFCFILFVLFVVFLLSPYSDFNPEWNEPPVRKSINGVLNVNLTASNTKTMIGGKESAVPVYNNKYIGDTWEVKGGDKINVKLTNDLSQPTNLHFHGSHVSPKGHSDNVLLAINSGKTFAYEYNLPANHPPGMYWYHPHFHPDVENQVLGGMLGAIKVRGAVDELEGIKGVSERVMVLTTQDGSNPNAPVRLVNGMNTPTMYLRPGQTVRLQIVNASADDFFNLAIQGYSLHIISRDGNTLDRVQSVGSEHMAPGQRIEILFTPTSYGTIPVKSLYLDQGFAKYTETTFMNFRVQGFPMLPTQLPKTLLPYEDLRTAKIDNTRTLTFSEGGTDTNPTFLLDGKEVDMDRVDQVITLGTTEEWRLLNKSSEMHPFHIHINPFQVISINGEPVDLHGYRDTVGVPANGEVVIRTRYKDFDGKFVLHCHILFHEDHGMMQVVEIVKPGKQQSEHNGVPELEMTQADMKMHMEQKSMPRGIPHQ